MRISHSPVEDILTAEQEQALFSVREALGDRLPQGNSKGRVYDDLTLLRFLRARSFNVQQATEMILQDLEWRKKHEVDDILDTFPQNKYFSSLFSYYPAAMHGVDKRGMPVYYQRIPHLHPKSLFSQVPTDVVVRFHIWYCEYSEKVYREHVAKKGIKYDHNGGFLFIEDISAIGWSHFYGTGIKTLQECFAMDSAHYPEALHKIYIINRPAVFSPFWKVLKPFLDSNTLEKVHISGNNFLDELVQSVSLENIPSIFGGKCTCKKGCLNGNGGKYTGYTDGGVTAEV